MLKGNRTTYHCHPVAVLVRVSEDEIRERYNWQTHVRKPAAEYSSWRGVWKRDIVI